MLVELGVVEQRYQAVLRCSTGRRSTEVAARYGVSRQTVHRWLRRYAAQGLAGWWIGSPRPVSCPHQMPAVVEARIVEMRRDASGVGSADDRSSAGPGGLRAGAGAKTSIYRCLVRHGLIDAGSASAQARLTTSGGNGRGRWSCGRWTSSAACGSPTGSEAKIVTGIDDHSRFCVSARWWWRGRRRGRCVTRWPGDAPLWDARSDLDGQRQGVHRPVRAGHR